MSEKEIHVILEDWLRKMNYPKENFPTEEELKTVCVGQLSNFWKEAIERTKPKNQVRHMRENIFVKSIRDYEKAENTSRAKLGQVLPPQILQCQKSRDGIQKKIYELRQAAEETNRLLASATLKTKTKYSELHRTKEELQQVRREVHLIRETTHQLKDDDKHSDEIIHTLQSSHLPTIVPDILTGSKSSASNLSNDAVLTNVADNLQKANSEDALKVDTALSQGVNVRWDFLLKRRETSLIEAQQCASADIVVKKNCPQRQRTHNLTALNTLHLHLELTALDKQKHYNAAFTKLQKLSTVPENHSELFKLQSKQAECAAKLQSLKDNLDLVKNTTGILASTETPRNDQFHQSLSKLQGSIVALCTAFTEKENEIKFNMKMLRAGVQKAQDLRHSLLRALGHPHGNKSDTSTAFCNSVMDASHMSRHLNISRLIASNECNLVEAARRFSECSTNEKILSASQTLYEEINFISKFNIGLNRKVYLENGEVIRIDETVSSTSAMDSDGNIPLWTVLNPMLSLSGIIKSNESLMKWHESLKHTYDSFSKTMAEINLENSFNQLNMREVSQKRIDNILKSKDSCVLPLESVECNIKAIDGHFEFFTNYDLRKYISNDRKVNGKTYKEHESDVQAVLQEIAYLK